MAHEDDRESLKDRINRLAVEINSVVEAVNAIGVHECRGLNCWPSCAAARTFRSSVHLYDVAEELRAFAASAFFTPQQREQPGEMSDKQPGQLKLGLSEEDRQVVLLALAHLSLERPGFDGALNEIAKRIDNVEAGRGQMYDAFRAPGSGSHVSHARSSAEHAGPRACVGVVVNDPEGRVLLGRRNKDPNRGKWVFPGGGIHTGESLVDAARRELREETGLDVTIVPQERFSHVVVNCADGAHGTSPGYRGAVIIFLRGTASGEPVAGDDLLEPTWFHLDQLPDDLSPISKEMMDVVCGPLVLNLPPGTLRAIGRHEGKFT